MVEVGDIVYTYIFPEECSSGVVVSKESETTFVVEWRNRVTGELYKQTILDYNIHENNSE